ncbi:MAG: hypothetical protein FWE49_05465 [Synergistaceae bacterium]|nr:hypothetical protein [Synergistaceae bacterium]
MKRILTCTLYIMIIIIIFSAPIHAASDSNGDKNPPTFTRYQFNQLGDSEILLVLYGKDLPTPEIILNDELNNVEIVFKNTSNDLKDTSFPIDMYDVSDVQAEQRGNDAVLVIRTTDDNFLVKELRGRGPIDRFTILFTAQRQQRRLEEEAKITRTLPALPLIPDFQKTSPVTLDVRDLPLADVVRLLAEMTKRNIVIDGSLPNEYVTMTLRQVPLNVAVDHLKRMYDIDFGMLGDNTILAGSRSGLARMSGREITRAFRVSYADITKVSALLASVMRLNDAEKGNIAVDERLRQLYITASPERLEEIAVALQSLDNPGKQVMLHARIFEFNDNFEEEVDSMLNAIYDNWWLTYAGGEGRIGVITDSGIRPSYGTGTVTVPNLQAPIPGIVEGSWRFLDAALKLSETKKIGKILANPSVITYDGEEAKVKLVHEFGYLVRQENGGYEIEFKEAGPILTMKPVIGRDGVITIKLDLEASEFIGRAPDGTPELSKRQVTTNVRVRNGEPFVVGGLRRESISKQRTKIPILGDIPLLGALFRHTYNLSEKSQVVMLIVPYILDTPDSKIEGVQLLFRR